MLTRNLKIRMLPYSPLLLHTCNICYLYCGILLSHSLFHEVLIKRCTEERLHHAALNESSRQGRNSKHQGRDADDCLGRKRGVGEVNYSGSGGSQIQDYVTIWLASLAALCWCWAFVDECAWHDQSVECTCLAFESRCLHCRQPINP